MQSVDSRLLARQAVMAILTAALSIPDVQDAHASTHNQRYIQLYALLVAQVGGAHADDLLRSQAQWLYYLFDIVSPTPSTNLPFHTARRARLREMLRIKV